MTESTPQHPCGSATQPTPPPPPAYPQLRVLGWLLIVAGFAGLVFGLVYFFADLTVAVVTTVSSLAAIGVGAGLPVLADIATNSFANNRMLARLAAHIQQSESPGADRSADE